MYLFKHFFAPAGGRTQAPLRFSKRLTLKETAAPAASRVCVYHVGRATAIAGRSTVELQAQNKREGTSPT